MRFGSFVFPVSKNPSEDHRVIDETLREIVACDRAGFHAVWLTEHHFDGVTAYADPVVFAAAVSQNTKRVKIGFAVLEMALHHPVRLAAQISLLDNLSNGRIIVGTGKGSSFNEYEYMGFGVKMDEARNMLLEAESLLVSAWSGEPVNFSGEFWNLSFPAMRPRPFQSPHPPIVRACISVDSMKEMASIGRPVLIGSTKNSDIEQRLNQFRGLLKLSGKPSREIESILNQSWVSKCLVVAESESQAKYIAESGFNQEQDHASQSRKLYNPNGHSSSVRDNFKDSFIYGTPDKVTDSIKELEDIGVRNLMLKLNTGGMDADAVQNSIKLFSKNVMPRFQ